MKNTEQFEELFIPRRELHISDSMIYRVYRDNRNFELIEAPSVIEALSKSKIRNAYKVERHDPMADNVIHLKQVLGGDIQDEEPIVKPVEKIAEAAKVLPQEKITEPEPVSNEAVAVAAEVEKEQAEPVETAAKTDGDVPLSNDEVDRLLNGG